MARFLRVSLFVLLVVGILPAGPAQAQPRLAEPSGVCAEQSSEAWQQQLASIRDDIRRLQNSPDSDDTILEELPGIQVSKATWIRLYTEALKEYADCLDQPEQAEPTEEQPGPAQQPVAPPQPGRTEFIPYHDGVCVLGRGFFCIDFDGRRYTRPDSNAGQPGQEGPAQAGAEGEPQPGSASVSPPALDATPQPTPTPGPRVIRVSGRWTIPGDDSGRATFSFNTGGGPITDGKWSTSGGSGTLAGTFTGTSIQNGTYSGTAEGQKTSGTWGGSMNASGVGSGTFSGKVGTRYTVSGSWNSGPQ